MTSEAQIIALMPMGEIAEQADDLAERSRSRLTLIDATGRVIADSDPATSIWTITSTGRKSRKPA